MSKNPSVAGTSSPQSDEDIFLEIINDKTIDLDRKADFFRVFATNHPEKIASCAAKLEDSDLQMPKLIELIDEDEMSNMLVNIFLNPKATESFNKIADKINPLASKQKAKLQNVIIKFIARLSAQDIQELITEMPEVWQYIFDVSERSTSAGQATTTRFFSWEGDIRSVSDNAGALCVTLFMMHTSLITGGQSDKNFDFKKNILSLFLNKIEKSLKEKNTKSLDIHSYRTELTRDARDDNAKHIATKTTDPKFYKIFSQIKILFANYPKCIDLLKDLNSEICKRQEDKKYEGVSLKNVLQVGNSFFPIPEDDYAVIRNRGSLLQRIIAEKLSKSGIEIGDEQYTFFGFIPSNKANEVIASGYIFRDSALTGIGLIHGKFTHLIQTYLLQSAIDQKILNLEDDTTLQELLDKMVSNEVWQSLLDIADTAIDQKGFMSSCSNVPSFHARLMLEEKLPYLAGYLRNEFYRGIKNIMEKSPSIKEENFSIEDLLVLEICAGRHFDGVNFGIKAPPNQVTWQNPNDADYSKIYKKPKKIKEDVSLSSDTKADKEEKKPRPIINAQTAATANPIDKINAL